MPGFDGTGPRGMGPMTGGARGYCVVGGGGRGYGVGYGVGLGLGRGYGRIGRRPAVWGGFAPLTGWRPPAFWGYGGAFDPTTAPEDDRAYLEGRARMLEEELRELRRQIDRLSAEAKEAE